MEMDEEVWNHAAFSKNRERLLNEEIAEGFFLRVIERAKPFISDEHFTVDGRLIEAWASQKSFRRKDGRGNPPSIRLCREQPTTRTTGLSTTTNGSGCVSPRRLVDMAARRGGTYYLTYHRYATRDQVESCYPKFAEFLRIKKKYDPDERFQSDWYRHYRTMFADSL
jgi:hypothetical protein